MIQEDVLSLLDADAILHDWAVNHRFKLKISSFQELLLKKTMPYSQLQR
jgi:hypothetical protein